jgi:hypothetical protein
MRSETDMPLRAIALAAWLTMAFLAPAAMAGGDDYDAANDVKGAWPAYFGFVRDSRGSPVTDAIVMLRPKVGKPVPLKTNALGLYRGHVSKEVFPDDVQVSCEKAGYTQAKVYRRTPPGSKDMFIETECTLQRR